MELTFFQLLQLIDITINRLESVFQFWLSATFAAIVASHLASDRLTKAYASMLTGLYLVFTFSVVVRMAAFRETLERYLLQEGNERGFSRLLCGGFGQHKYLGDCDFGNLGHSDIYLAFLPNYWEWAGKY